MARAPLHPVQRTTVPRRQPMPHTFLNSTYHFFSPSFYLRPKSLQFAWSFSFRLTALLTINVFARLMLKILHWIEQNYAKDITLMQFELQWLRIASLQIIFQLQLMIEIRRSHFEINSTRLFSIFPKGFLFFCCKFCKFSSVRRSFFSEKKAQQLLSTIKMKHFFFAVV